jgi:hypothetical protein
MSGVRFVGFIPITPASAAILQKNLIKVGFEPPKAVHRKDAKNAKKRFRLGVFFATFASLR